MNLTHEPDYLNVLGSLNVVNNKNEIPDTSKTLVSIKSETMKNLKNQKRKIEMNEDDDENVETQIRMVEAPIRENESLVVSFKRYK